MIRPNSTPTHSSDDASAEPHSLTPIRIVVLGTGTAIGKTYVSQSLTIQLGRRLPEYRIVALKPLESGLPTAGPGDSLTPAEIHASDASTLAAASRPPFCAPKPPYVLPEPLSPHLSARRSGQVIESERVLDWIDHVENSAIQSITSDVSYVNAVHRDVVCCHVTQHTSPAERPTCFDRSTSGVASPERTSTQATEPPAAFMEPSPVEVTATRQHFGNVPQVTLIETAGGVFSPLNDHDTNFDFATKITRSIWILVAPDRLGVLHDLTVTLATMRARGKTPDFIVLSQPSADDPSLNTNVDELLRLQIANVDGVIPYQGAPTDALMSKLIERIKAYDDADEL